MCEAAPLPRRTCGARFSITDGAALALGALGTWATWDELGTYRWMFAAALGHFFLFCNVFRVRRSYELLWTAVFLGNFAAWLLAGRFSWAWVLGLQTPLTALLIGLEVRSPRYHGIGCERLNPDLPRYMSGELD
jgi:hypothetical protein